VQCTNRLLILTRYIPFLVHATLGIRPPGGTNADARTPRIAWTMIGHDGRAGLTRG
jgi:hypothetical protein